MKKLSEKLEDQNLVLTKVDNGYNNTVVAGKEYLDKLNR